LLICTQEYVIKRNMFACGVSATVGTWAVSKQPDLVREPVREPVHEPVREVHEPDLFDRRGQSLLLTRSAEGRR
jgi:hypothetical protein